MTMPCPTIYNADTLGIRPDLVGRPITSWADIIDPKFKGKTSILNIPSIGIMDAAMIAEAMGRVKYGDKGNMTQAEIDATIEMLIEAKKRRPVPRVLEELRRVREPHGLGRGRDPVDVVARGRRRPRQGRPVRLPAAQGRLSRLGRRPWRSPSTSGHRARRRLRVHQLVHVRLGRRLPQPAGLLLGLSSRPPAPYMSADEWGFWMEGKPAQGDIKPDGTDRRNAPAPSATAARSTTAWAPSPAGTR
jgi:putative spermidine/putrescine transport system substrate-binding protein